MAVPLNRRPDQVGVLGGPTLSAGYMFGHAGIWLDFDSYGNADASHGTFLLSGSFAGEVRNKLQIGGRAGIGTTLVNFDEPAFMDVTATTFRIEGTVDYSINESWKVWGRPFSLDIMSADELGGPITTWQMRVGIAYRFGGHKAAQPAAAPMTAPAAQPTAPAPGQPPAGQPPPAQAPAGPTSPAQPQPGQAPATAPPAAAPAQPSPPAVPAPGAR